MRGGGDAGKIGDTMQSQATTPSTQAAGGSAGGTAELVERLTRLRTVLPAMGHELATARREAAKLRVENGRLRDRLHVLEAKASRRRAPTGSASKGS